MDPEVAETSKDEAILVRHRKEKKDLQSKIQHLKKSINNNKKKKKEVTDEIARLENELQERHEKELAEIDVMEKVDVVCNGISSVSLSQNPDNECLGDELADNQGGAPKVHQGRKVSKAEKRRQKKAEANREREARIKEEIANNKFCARNVEAGKLKKLLRARNLKMFEIKPDGDCMYAAIAHQMVSGTTVPWLRSQAGQYIRSHSDEFAPFITDPKTGEMMTPEQFDIYCGQIENTPAWGGQAELRALSQVMKRKIEVLQARLVDRSSPCGSNLFQFLCSPCG